MNLRSEIANLNTAFGSMAADLGNHQARLLALASRLESMMGKRAGELADETSCCGSVGAARIAELGTANAALTRQVALLESSNRETTLMEKMNSFLQSCTTEAEAYSIVAETATQLFPDDSGAVFVLSASRNMLEAAAVWGALAPTRLIFPPADCWAQRRGQVHLATAHMQRCSHVSDPQHMCVCIPLLALGETLGILHLQDGTIRQDASAIKRMHDKTQLATRFSNNIGLGISSLKSRESMRNLSIRDPLTGLFNRRYMEEAMAQEQARAQRNHSQLAVIMIDIDHFKRFNDQYGHDGGDAVLRDLGGFLKEQVRGSDIACRYGGEEFILILSQASAAGARLRAETIRAGAAQLGVVHAHRPLEAISLSLGIAMFPDHGPDPAAVIKAADIALYQAKRSGRDRFVMAGDPLSQGDLATPLEPACLQG